MSKLELIELCCPVCDNYFRSAIVESPAAPAAKRTDFHEQSNGVAALPYQVHMCARCGFSGAESDFSGDTELSAGVIDHVWSELAPVLMKSSGVASEKYEAAAKVVEWSGGNPKHAADLWLRAAWCCVDEDDVEAERYYRRIAARGFEASLVGYDDVAREERAVVTYLTGELWRRIGDLKKARAWFDRVFDEIVDSSSQQWVVAAAKQQRDAPRDFFA